MAQIKKYQAQEDMCLRIWGEGPLSIRHLGTGPAHTLFSENTALPRAPWSGHCHICHHVFLAPDKSHWTFWTYLSISCWEVYNLCDWVKIMSWGNHVSLLEISN